MAGDECGYAVEAAQCHDGTQEEKVAHRETVGWLLGERRRNEGGTEVHAHGLGSWRAKGL